MTSLPPSPPPIAWHAQAPATASAVRFTIRHDWRRRMHADPGPPPVKVPRPRLLWRPRPMRAPRLIALNGQSITPGSDALGVSVPKRERWAVLGGHGRNGAG